MKYKIGDELIDTDNSHIEYARVYNKGKKDIDKMITFNEPNYIVDVTNSSVQILIHKKTNHGIDGLQWVSETDVEKRFKIKK